MPLKKQNNSTEMTQVSSTEYVFGENGGLGKKHSFFKRSSSHSHTRVKPVLEDPVKLVGAQFSHLSMAPARKLTRVMSATYDSPTKTPRASGTFSTDDVWSLADDEPIDLSPKKLSRVSSNQTETNIEVEEINAMMSRVQKFQTVLANGNVDLVELKKLSWNGVPFELRPAVWKLLFGYLPTNAERREGTLKRKRKEYLDGIDTVFNKDKRDQATWHQINIDLPRTHPTLSLYQQKQTQESLMRILYLWSVRHPASGYVQGINDLVTPIFQTFLTEYSKNIESLSQFQLDALEADSYWCLTKLLDGIQDNYIHAQPGIIRQVNQLQDLTERIDLPLYKHMMSEHVEFIQFSFRWMNCLLMREFKLDAIIRMWDTYLSEGGFQAFHVYVCAAFLVKWSDKLLDMDFQDMITFLQNPPTKEWNEGDMEMLLSEAFIWQTLYKDATAHWSK